MSEGQTEYQELAQAFPKDQGQVAYLIRSYIEAREKSKQWEVVGAGYQVALQKLMDERGVRAFKMPDGSTLTRVADGLSSRLDKQRLLKYVTADQLAACSIETKRRGYVLVETPEQKNQRQLVRAGMRSDAE